MKPAARIALQQQAPLPVREGVAPSRVYLPRGQWPSLMHFLVQRFPHVSPADLRRRLLAGDIVDAQGAPRMPDSPYQGDQWLWYYREVPHEAAVPFDLPVLHHDDCLVAVDKPHFLASVPGGAYLRETALTRLRDTLDMPQLTPLHRLDRDTAGVLVFCARPQARGAYQSLFQQRGVCKEYEAVVTVAGEHTFPVMCSLRLEPVPGRFTVQVVPGEPNSHTQIECLARWRDPGSGQWRAHLRLQPSSGRKHQLRAHLAWLGLPIVNDAFYPVLLPARAADDYSEPLQLLARRLVFTDPLTGQERVFESGRKLALLP